MAVDIAAALILGALRRRYDAELGPAIGRLWPFRRATVLDVEDAIIAATTVADHSLGGALRACAVAPGAVR